MKRISFFLVCTLLLAGCGGGVPSDNPNLAANNVSMTAQSSEGRNSLCDVVSPQRVGDLVRQTLAIDVISPEDQPPLTCQYSGGGVTVTIMATKGADVSERHAMNADGIVTDDLIADLGDLGDGSVGFTFNDLVNGDAYEDDVWVNVSVESSLLTAEEKTAVVKEIIDMVFVGF